MNEEIKKLIESVDMLSPEDIKIQARTDKIEGYPERSYVELSDFDRVVEELTKWNKVEDCLPESKDILIKVLVKIQGKRLQCNLGITTAVFDKRTGKFKTGEKYVEVTEWKPII